MSDKVIELKSEPELEMEVYEEDSDDYVSEQETCKVKLEGKGEVVKREIESNTTVVQRVEKKIKLEDAEGITAELEEDIEEIEGISDEEDNEDMQIFSLKSRNDGYIQIDSDSDSSNGKDELPKTKVPKQSGFAKCPYSYGGLIYLAFENTDKAGLYCHEIAQFIVENFPFYENTYNLSRRIVYHLRTNRCFKRCGAPGLKRAHCSWLLDYTQKSEIATIVNHLKLFTDIYSDVLAKSMRFPELIQELILNKLQYEKKSIHNVNTSEGGITTELTDRYSVWVCPTLNTFDTIAERNKDKKLKKRGMPILNKYVITDEDKIRPKQPVDISKVPDLIKAGERFLKMQRPPPFGHMPKAEKKILRKMSSDFPKPPMSYSELITLALLNGYSQSLTCEDIYMFVELHFPYFIAVSSSWKSCIRHTLSTGPFTKVMEMVGDGTFAVGQKNNLWTFKECGREKIKKRLIQKLNDRRLEISLSMKFPEKLDALIRGESGGQIISRKMKPGNPRSLQGVRKYVKEDAILDQGKSPSSGDEDMVDVGEFLSSDDDADDAKYSPVDSPTKRGDSYQTRELELLEKVLSTGSADLEEILNSVPVKRESIFGV